MSKNKEDKKMNYPIVYAINDNLIELTCVSITSIIHNLSYNSDDIIEIFILYKNLNELSIKKLKTFNNKKVTVSFKKIDYDFTHIFLKHCTKSFTEEIYFRLLIPDLINYNYVLYLDADTVCNINIKSLFQICIEDKSIAAVHDIGMCNKSTTNYEYLKTINLNPELYFNSGVILFNNIKIKKDKNSLIEKIRIILNKYPNLLYPDQDALNIIFKDDIFFLDYKYNYTWLPFVYYTSREIYSDNLKLDNYLKSSINPYIIHFTGQKKFIYQLENNFSKIFWKYVKISPFKTKVYLYKKKFFIISKRIIKKLIINKITHKFYYPFKLFFQKIKNINLDKKIKNKNSKTLFYSVPYSNNEKNYNYLICLTGFGCSGSGAILDYLTEFDNTSVFGYHDYNKSNNYPEFNFFRCPGSIFDLEKNINSDGYFNEDHAIKVFLHILEYFYRFEPNIMNDKQYEIFNNFIDEIIDYKIKTRDGFEGQYMFELKTDWEWYANLHSPLCTNCPSELRFQYKLKNLAIDEYRAIARKYILKYLNFFESNEYMVLDQVLSTSKADINRKLDYFGNFKLICSYRDPRDVYTTGFKLNLDWIPKEPDIFCKWYIDRGVKSYKEEIHPNKLDIQFEDFILHHDEVSEKINSFLGLDASHHVNKGKYLILEKSKENIGIYKNFEDQEAIRYIEKTLPEYLYNLKE